MSTEIRSVKGTRDLLPPETAVWAEVETCARRVFSLYGYQEIRTPVLEPTELFVRSVGETTDIVGKEMYSFDDRKGRKLSLRPESTASVARAFVQHGIKDLPARLFYIGPHFRYERPQKGRYREFHQIGAELLGDQGPHSDAELITMLLAFLQELGFEELQVALNTVGDVTSRQGYRQALVEFLLPRQGDLSEESRRRLATNPLRILDTKDAREKEILLEAPRLEQYLNAESRGHFQTVCSLLADEDVSYLVEPHLVRGLDYYSRTVFEISAAGLGAQDAVVGGGRYDGLVASLGGPDLAAIGFAIGEDRLIEILPKSFRAKAKAEPAVVIVPIEPLDRAAAMEVAAELRRAGIAAVPELSGGSVKSALRRADRRGTRFVVLLGEDEIASGGVALKDLMEGEQSFVLRQELASKIGELR